MMPFILTPEAIALCLAMGLPNCHDGGGGITFFALEQHAIQRGLYDSGAGCPVTLKGTVTTFCPPPPGKECIVTGRYSMPGYPNGVVYLCREPAQS
jgi:hypothetical protein